jgi:hypothetical protein
MDDELGGVDLTMERRTFLCWLVSGAAALPMRGVRLHAQSASLSDASVATLRALAPVLLPTELGAAGHEKVVSDFVQWLSAYRAGAERSWGYGSPRRSSTPAISAAAYDEQLRAIDARARGGAGDLQSLPLDVRRTIAAGALDAARVQSLPGSPNGQHVIADFMSFFYNSGAASDLVYRARIARATCRGLGGALERPGD